jgi:hypothetical protein
MEMRSILHLTAFKRNLGDVTRLMEVHSLLASRVSGRAAALQVLNRSAVVLLSACWEAYIEDLALSAFDWMLANSTNSDSFPKRVRARAGRSIRDSKDELAIWALADLGWRAVLKKHRDETIKGAIASFNSPKAERIDDLYSNLIGLTKLSSSWRWRGSSADRSRDKLERLLTIRGDIAHRVRHTGFVTRPELDDFVAFTDRLSILSHNAVVDHLVEVASAAPWPKMEYITLDMGTPAERRKRVKRTKWKNDRK